MPHIAWIYTAKWRDYMHGATYNTTTIACEKAEPKELPKKDTQAY
jgi:hypothetical protein